MRSEPHHDKGLMSGKEEEPCKHRVLSICRPPDKTPKGGDLKWAFFTALAVLSSAMLAEDNKPQWTVAATDVVAAFAADDAHANPRADASGKGTWAFYVEQADGTQRMMAYGVKAGANAALRGSWMEKYY